MIDNRDLRLINVKSQDQAYYNHRIFIETWQQAASLKDVTRKLRLSIHQAVSKALFLRSRHKIPLKYFKFRPTPAQVIALRQLALASYRPDPRAVPMDKFIRTWNRSNSLRAVAKTFNIPLLYTSALGSKLRRLGLKLRMFRRGPNSDENFVRLTHKKAVS